MIMWFVRGGAEQRWKALLFIVAQRRVDEG